MLITRPAVTGRRKRHDLKFGHGPDYFCLSGRKRGRIIGLNTSAVYIGLSAAPLLGGFLTQHFGWHSLFYINAIAGCLIIVGHICMV